MRTWIIALAALLVLPAVGAAATIVVGPVQEQLVEGHTVFTVIEVRNDTNVTQEEFHAAVAVLVREVRNDVDASRFPGVLWFNDQYLVPPSSSGVAAEQSVRYPCTGAVIAVGDTYGADPRVEFTDANPLSPGYVESYLIRDPNDHAWSVDKWSGANGFIWTVAILGDDTGYSTGWDSTDDSCNPYEDMGNCDLFALNGNIPGPGGAVGSGEGAAVAPGPAGEWCSYRYRDPGEHDETTGIGMGYPCGQDGVHVNCENLQYNALLYFRMSDLVTSGGIDHNPSSTAYKSHISGCHPTYGSYGSERKWPCPTAAQNDDMEGNSHPYNPELPWPLMSYDGRNNHGGSADCDGDGVADGPTDPSYSGVPYTGDYNCHETADIMIYYGVAEMPVPREYYLTDAQGSEAPYHCHDDMAVCNLQEALADPQAAGTQAGDYATDQAS